MRNRSIKVKEWSAESLLCPYDAFFSSLGFERRSRHVAEAFNPQAKHRIASAFPDRRILSYSENQEWLQSAGYRIEEISDKDFYSWFRKALGETLDRHRIAVDVSSISRFRLAVIVDCLRRLEGSEDVHVDFIYNVAQFSEPPREVIPNIHVGPVAPNFAGWSTEPDQPPLAVIGLGYEEAKALGALEHIQASEAWLFRPWSGVEEYSRALAEANTSLLESTAADRILDYVVEHPFDCFATLELLVGRLRLLGSPLIFPFGPKIFTVCSLLAACLYEEVSVWRVSAGSYEIPLERLPTEIFCGLNVIFEGLPAED